MNNKISLTAAFLITAFIWLSLQASSPGLRVSAYSNPSQWNDTCDTQHYANSAPLPNNPNLPNLTNPWEGIYACGPRPETGIGDVYTNEILVGSVPLYEWECVELVERYLYLGYQVIPYVANGNQIVSNFNGTGNGVTAVQNDGNHGLPGVGDVLSYDGVHTSIVVATPSGSSNYYTVFQQNDPSTYSNNDVYVYTSGG